MYRQVKLTSQQNSQSEIDHTNVNKLRQLCTHYVQQIHEITKLLQLENDKVKQMKCKYY